MCRLLTIKHTEQNTETSILLKLTELASVESCDMPVVDLIADINKAADMRSIHDKSSAVTVLGQSVKRHQHSYSYPPAHPPGRGREGEVSAGM